MDDPSRALVLLKLGISGASNLTRAGADELLRALTETPVRDAAIAIAVGRTADAAALLNGSAASAPWLTCGPLDAVSIGRGRALFEHLEANARTAGEQYSTAPATILAYLDWATGHPVAAARRLAQVPATYSMAALLRHLVAIGAPRPRIANLAMDRQVRT
jgi:hypothetical protein